MEITVQELKAWKDEGKDFQLIDVREGYEVEICTLDGDHIPMGDIMSQKDKVRRDAPVVVHCRSGKRSAAVIANLEQEFGFDNLYNLTGGILAYAAEVDNSLDQY